MTCASECASSSSSSSRAAKPDANDAPPIDDGDGPPSAPIAFPHDAVGGDRAASRRRRRRASRESSSKSSSSSSRDSGTTTRGGGGRRRRRALATPGPPRRAPSGAFTRAPVRERERVHARSGLVREVRDGAGADVERRRRRPSRRRGRMQKGAAAAMQEPPRVVRVEPVLGRVRVLRAVHRRRRRAALPGGATVGIRRRRRRRRRAARRHRLSRRVRASSRGGRERFLRDASDGVRADPRDVPRGLRGDGTQLALGDALVEPLVVVVVVVVGATIIPWRSADERPAESSSSS